MWYLGHPKSCPKWGQFNMGQCRLCPKSGQFGVESIDWKKRQSLATILNFALKSSSLPHKLGVEAGFGFRFSFTKPHFPLLALASSSCHFEKLTLALILACANLRSRLWVRLCVLMAWGLASKPEAWFHPQTWCPKFLNFCPKLSYLCQKILTAPQNLPIHAKAVLTRYSHW